MTNMCRSSAAHYVKICTAQDAQTTMLDIFYIVSEYVNASGRWCMISQAGESQPVVIQASN
jgi:hypothetical protein